MDTPRISIDDMESKYVGRYAKCSGSDLAYLDQRPRVIACL
jgi:hypothetical protein